MCELVSNVIGVIRNAHSTNPVAPVVSEAVERFVAVDLPPCPQPLFPICNLSFSEMPYPTIQKRRKKREQKHSPLHHEIAEILCLLAQTHFCDRARK